MSKPLIAIASLALAVPAIGQAQESTVADDDSYNMVIVYGDDECPESTEDVIVVCARKSEDERYRIPQNLRFSDSPENKSWAERVESFEMVGDFGTMSCSPTGAGGRWDGGGRAAGGGHRHRTARSGRRPPPWAGKK